MGGGDTCKAPLMDACHQDRGRNECLGFLSHVGREAGQGEGADLAHVVFMCNKPVQVPVRKLSRLLSGPPGPAEIVSNMKTWSVAQQYCLLAEAGA